MERSGLGRGVWSASTHQHGRSLETREGRRGEGTSRSCRRLRIAPPAHTARARARTPPDRTVVSRVVGWIDNTTIAIGSSARARLGGACGLCRVHSPAKGTGVATADDIAAACMLLSQTRATTGRSRSLQWRHRAGISARVAGFFSDLIPSGQNRPIRCLECNLGDGHEISCFPHYGPYEVYRN